MMAALDLTNGSHFDLVVLLPAILFGVAIWVLLGRSSRKLARIQEEERVRVAKELEDLQLLTPSIFSAGLVWDEESGTYRSQPETEETLRSIVQESDSIEVALTYMRRRYGSERGRDGADETPAPRA